jgi:putative membrane protein
MSWTTWDPAPAVLAGAGLTLLLFAHAFARLRRRGRGDHAPWSRVVLFALAIAAGTLPLVSALDELGDSYLLSGHMLQHVLIGDAAPALALVALRGPLLFFLFPRTLVRRLTRIILLRRALALLLRPRVSLAAWMLVSGAWHVPAAYDYALTNQNVHDLEHLSFIAAGVLVWTQLVDPARRNSLRERFGCMIAMGVFALVVGTVLIATAPLYPSYADQTIRLFGISPALDQQLAGVVMIAEQMAALAGCACFVLGARVPLRGTSRARPTSSRQALVGKAC